MKNNTKPQELVLSWQNTLSSTTYKKTITQSWLSLSARRRRVTSQPQRDRVWSGEVEITPPVERGCMCVLLSMSEQFCFCNIKIFLNLKTFHVQSNFLKPRPLLPTNFFFFFIKIIRGRLKGTCLETRTGLPHARHLGGIKKRGEELSHTWNNIRPK